MTFKRFFKAAKVVNKQMLFQSRREPYKPVMADRQLTTQQARLADLESRCAAGEVFVPDKGLPPWRRSVTTHLIESHQPRKIKGLRVRAVDRQDEPGFPTHFR